MAAVNIQHTFNCSEDTFWDRIFFDESFNQHLYKEVLGFSVYKVKSLDDKGDEIQRVIEVSPKIGDLPGPIKKVVGENVSYAEEGIYDKKSRRYRLQIKPNALADKLSIKGELFTEPSGPSKCKRIFKADVTCKVFGIGGMIEKRIVADIEKSYDFGAKFTNEYIAEKGL